MMMITIHCLTYGSIREFQTRYVSVICTYYVSLPTRYHRFISYTIKGGTKRFNPTSVDDCSDHNKQLKQNHYFTFAKKLLAAHTKRPRLIGHLHKQSERKTWSYLFVLHFYSGYVPTCCYHINKRVFDASCIFKYSYSQIEVRQKESKHSKELLPV